MCHLILLLPLVTLPVFWVLPLSYSIPVYAVVLVVSAIVFRLAVRAMHRPIGTGTEALPGSRGEVIDASGHPVRVRVRGEIWNAKSSGELVNGDVIVVTGVDELVLTVVRADDGSVDRQDLRGNRFA
ncbi:MAG: hypothetical protein GC151_12695 [Betaproteobacteria bacterium]|nr:hypothetical protein [Betaproteobacteria bacterium]